MDTYGTRQKIINMIGGIRSSGRTGRQAHKDKTHHLLNWTPSIAALAPIGIDCMFLACSG